MTRIRPVRVVKRVRGGADLAASQHEGDQACRRKKNASHGSVRRLAAGFSLGGAHAVEGGYRLRTPAGWLSLRAGTGKGRPAAHAGEKEEGEEGVWAREERNRPESDFLFRNSFFQFDFKPILKRGFKAANSSEF